MGGVFSGRRYWENSTRKKSFTVEFSSIDSLQVHKSLSQAEDGYLGDAIRLNMFYLSFKLIDQKGVVYFVGYGKRLGLNFSANIVSTPCFYGGFRCWFRCGYCDRRVRFLYFKNKKHVLSLACRTCHNLPYQSQNRSFSDRILEKRRKINKKLGSTGDGWPSKPKGMHTSTYDKLMEQKDDLCSLSMQAFMFKIRSYKQFQIASFRKNPFLNK